MTMNKTLIIDRKGKQVPHSQQKKQAFHWQFPHNVR